MNKEFDIFLEKLRKKTKEAIASLEREKQTFQSQNAKFWEKLEREYSRSNHQKVWIQTVKSLSQSSDTPESIKKLIVLFLKGLEVREFFGTPTDLRMSKDQINNYQGFFGNFKGEFGLSFSQRKFGKEFQRFLKWSKASK